MYPPSRQTYFVDFVLRVGIDRYNVITDASLDPLKSESDVEVTRVSFATFPRLRSLLGKMPQYTRFKGILIHCGYNDATGELLHLKDDILLLWLQIMEINFGVPVIFSQTLPSESPNNIPGIKAVNKAIRQVVYDVDSPRVAICKTTSHFWNKRYNVKSGLLQQGQLTAEGLIKIKQLFNDAFAKLPV